jgi:hypothetical protein
MLWREQPRRREHLLEIEIVVLFRATRQLLSHQITEMIGSHFPKTADVTVTGEHGHPNFDVRVEVERTISR